MSEEMALIIKYPWSEYGNRFRKEIDLDAEDLIIRNDLLERAKNDLAMLIRGDQRKIKFRKDYDEFYVFLLRIYLATLLQNKFIASRLSIFEQKRAYHFLKEEENDVLIELARSTFNWNIEIEKYETKKEEYTFKLYFIDYINANTFKETKWALVNRVLIAGYVYLTKYEVARLISGVVKERIYRHITTSNVKKVPATLQPIINELNKLIEKHQIQTVTVKKDKTSFPPCMTLLLQKLEKGENLTHMERFAITAFLLNIGYSVDEVVDLFRNAPDFDENIARYQIEHINGMRGSGTKYTTPSCETLKTHKICPDPNCNEKKNPLRYYNRYAKNKK